MGMSITFLRHVHIAGFALLLAFLVRGLWLDLRALRATDRATLFHILESWHAMVSWAPRVGAASILVSGFLLVQFGTYSFAEGWLFVAFALFALEMADGIFHYDPYVKRLLNEVRIESQGVEVPKAVRDRLRSRQHQASLLLHLAVFPIIYWLGLMKPAFEPPFHEAMVLLSSCCGIRFLPGVVLLAIAFGAVYTIRRVLK